MSLGMGIICSNHVTTNQSATFTIIFIIKLQSIQPNTIMDTTIPIHITNDSGLLMKTFDGELLSFNYRRWTNIVPILAERLVCAGYTAQYQCLCITHWYSVRWVLHKPSQQETLNRCWSSIKRMMYLITCIRVVAKKRLTGRPKADIFYIFLYYEQFVRLFPHFRRLFLPC